MRDLRNIEKMFNESFDFDSIMKNAKKDIEKTLAECETNFLTEDEEGKGYPFQELTVEYNRTCIFINKNGSNPYFRLNFYLYEPNCETPKFMYDVDYNCLGEFLDAYFLDY